MEPGPKPNLIGSEYESQGRPPDKGGSERLLRAGGSIFRKPNPPFAFGSRPPCQGVGHNQLHSRAGYFMSGINYSEKIPNNVNLVSDRTLQRALEHWQPHFLDWWKGMGPTDFQGADVYLRTAVSVDSDGWAQ